jgi:fatty acid desaturase
MPQPERLDLQLRRARHRREALRIGLPVALVIAALAIYSLWSAAGWRWWYVPLTLASVVAGLWLSRLETDATEEATRWFWRPPK